MKLLKCTTGVLAVAIACVLPAMAQAPAGNTSFFVTSMNPGSGGDLGGLSGADAYCATLAEDAGITGKTWRAYLSTSDVDARDRIGEGPWYNVKGVMIAENVEQLHGENHLTSETALNEKGGKPGYLMAGGGRPETLEHDILTGSHEDGTASDMTCNNWTDGSADAQATLGHADRMGREAGVNSWNSVHPSQGCAMENLRPTGGAGLFYCFAID
jgi:hypothetical protein